MGWKQERIYEEDQDLEATFSEKCWTAPMENETDGEDGSHADWTFMRQNWPNYGFVERENSWRTEWW